MVTSGVAAAGGPAGAVIALSVVLASTARGLVPVERRQYPQVFRVAGRLLRPDHVGEVSDNDFHLAHAKAVRRIQRNGLMTRMPA